MAARNDTRTSEALTPPNLPYHRIFPSGRVVSRRDPTPSQKSSSVAVERLRGMGARGPDRDSASSSSSSSSSSTTDDDDDDDDDDDTMRDDPPDDGAGGADDDEGARARPSSSSASAPIVPPHLAHSTQQQQQAREFGLEEVFARVLLPATAAARSLGVSETTFKLRCAPLERSVGRGTADSSPGKYRSVGHVAVRDSCVDVRDFFHAFVEDFFFVRAGERERVVWGRRARGRCVWRRDETARRARVDG